MSARTCARVLGFVAAVLLAEAAWTPRIACGGDETDPVAVWDTEWRAACMEAVGVHADFCVAWSSECARSVATARFRILRIDPENEATRTALGYVMSRREAGAPVWTRSEPAREKVRGLSDRWPDETASFAAILRKADITAAARLAVLGRSAQERADAGGGAAWTERARRAWDAALVWDRENEAANRALGNKKFEGRFCRPEDVRLLSARLTRRMQGEKEIARATFPEDVAPKDGSPLAAAGLAGAAVATPHVWFETTLDPDSAIHVAWKADPGARLLVAEFGSSSASAAAFRAARIYVLKSAGEARTLLEKGAGWKLADIERALGADAGWGRIGRGEWFVVGESNEERVARTTDVLVRIAFRAVRGDADTPAATAWIERGVADDLRVRLDAIVTHVSSRHGASWPARRDPGLELARRMVETDDDVPVAALSTASEEERKSARWAAKARLFLQFLFERDAAKAREFVAGTKTGQPESAEALDAEYRRWVVETF